MAISKTYRYSGLVCGLVTLWFLSSSRAIFVKENWLDGIRTNQKNYGVAVSDVNHDGRPDFIVAGYNGANFVFVYDNSTGKVTNIARQDNPAYAALMDVPGAAIGESCYYSDIHFFSSSTS